MRIVLLNDDFPMGGGSSVAHLTKVLAEEFRQQNHQVTVVTTHRREEDANVLTGENGEVVSIPVSYRRSLRHYFSVYNPQVSRVLQQVLKRLQPDVVHAQNIHEYLTYDSLRIARKFTYKVFMTCHDVMSIAYGRLATERYLSSGGKNTKLYFWDHLQVAGLQYNPLRNTLIRRKINQNTTKVIAVSDALNKALCKNGIQNTSVIHNGSNPTYWKTEVKDVEVFTKEHNLAGRKVILFAGRLRRDKGTTPLLRAVDVIRKTIPEVLLVVVGEKDRWQGLVQEADISKDMANHQQCIGWLPHKELAAAYGACNVVATPSLCLDTFNLVNLEAMANSKPVVGTIFGGAPEVIQDGITGYVCNPLDTASLAQALEKVLTDDTLAKKMETAGYKRASEVFTIKSMVENYLKLYRR